MAARRDPTWLGIVSCMANPEHLAILKRGVGVWNQWRKENPNVTPDLSEADLRKSGIRGRTFGGQDLRGELAAITAAGGGAVAELVVYGRYLSGVNFRKSDLSSAILCDAELSDADLSGADLQHADLRKAHLVRTLLNGTDLRAAKLKNASFSGTIFGHTNLRGAKGLENCRHSTSSIIDHQTIVMSWPVPVSFLRGCGLQENYIEYLPSLLHDQRQFYSCFISYSHADKPFARRLHDTLQGRGIRCWLDEKQLLPGDDIYEQVDRGIRLWDKVLLCCSEHSLKPASWVDKEIITALEKEDQLTRKRGEKIRALIPLNIDGYLFNDAWKSGYRAEIRRRMAADFTGWERDNATFEEQVEHVIRALRADDGGRESPPEPRL
jgi:uncharacterized protein YjbI with pentapeptide repeats